MNMTSIFGPFFAMILLTFIVWVYMYIRRLSFIAQNRISPAELATPGALAKRTPLAVATPADNLRNLFEVPVLFYAMALYLHATGQVDALHVTAAWVFVAFRVLHSAVHCTFNHVPLRFGLYIASTLALAFMVLRALPGLAG